MQRSYDPSHGQRDKITPPPEPRKTRICIRIDPDLIDYFKWESKRTGGQVGYQSLINNALRRVTEGRI
jgi:uncharacterized protein (DUF4415 family)